MYGAIQFPDFLSPEIFTISAFGLSFSLRWYAMAYIVGILIGWRISVAAVRRPALWPGSKAPLTVEQVEDLLTWIIVGVIVGGRLGFVLFYQPGYYLQNPIDILKVWQGGMAFHGGFAGVVLAVWLVARKYGAPLGQVADMLAISVPPALLLGRMANFINAELWGRPTDAPWGVIFPGQAAQDCAGFVSGLCARHPSQLYEAALEGLVLGALLLWLAFRRNGLHRTWMTSGLFFLCYGAARFFVELYRQADAQFITVDNPMGYVVRLGDFGISMGQALSLPMIAIGLLLVLVSRRLATA